MKDNIRQLRPAYPIDKYEPFTLDKRGLENLRYKIKTMLTGHLRFALGHQPDEETMQRLLNDKHCLELVNLALSTSPPPNSYADNPKKNLAIAEAVRLIYHHLGEQQQLTSDVLTNTVQSAFAQVNASCRTDEGSIIDPAIMNSAFDAISGHLQRISEEIARQSRLPGI